MCTVTYLPTKDNNFKLCVNRDESPLRPKALPPAIQTINGVRFCAPIDPEAGGTWIGLNEHKHLILLLNGAFEPHKRHTPYRKSRGLIVLDFLTSLSVLEQMASINLKGIEPFTLLSISWENNMHFKALKWDGEKRYVQFLSPATPHLICSAPLYDSRQKALRHHTFNQWLKKTPQSDLQDQILLHKLPDMPKQTGFNMNRHIVKSVSVTGIEKNGDHCVVYYEDLETGTIHQSSF